MNQSHSNHLTALEMAMYLNVDPDTTSKLHSILQSESYQVKSEDFDTYSLNQK